MTGKIFNIQRFSIHDGPGIRTTVFMKGCNLRCLWCHNPESHKKCDQLMFYKEKCTHCGKCIELCDRRHTEECVACGRCVSVCESSALEICGREINTVGLFEEIKKDIKFYNTSGGGVTFSGGEPLLQYEFLGEVLKLCKNANINTAVETAANVPWSVFEELLPYIDYIICDIKSLDEKKHIFGTGASNKLILSNVEKLKNSGKEVLFRTPFIIGFNDEEIGDIAKMVFPCRLELMPYHSFGEGKCVSLGIDYPAKAYKEADADLLREITEKYSNVFYTQTRL